MRPKALLSPDHGGASCSLVLGAPQSPLFASTLWLWLAVFVGVNLAQSGVTGFCPAETILRKLGLRGAADSAAARGAST